MSFGPNYFVDPEPWLTIRFGSGAPIKAALTKIDGVSTEHTFKDQKAKEKSGSQNVFSGTKWDKPKLTFVACDEDDFDDLRALWDLMKPVPGQGTGTVAATPAPGQTFAIGSPAKADSGGSAGGSSGSTSTGGATASGGTSPAADPTDKKDAKSKDPDPGPRPPTIAVAHPLLAWHEIFACALTKWEGPTHTDTNGMEVVITIIADKPPVPAGTGVMAAPAPGSQFAGGAAGSAGGGGTGSGTPQEKVDKDAAGGAAGT